MKAVLVLLLLGEYLFTNAQTLEQRVAGVYASFFDLHDYGFKLNPTDESDKASKYTSFKIQQLNRGKDVWQNTDSAVIFYNNQGNVSSEIFYGYIGKVWRKSRKSEIVFDATGKPEATMVYIWNNIENQWQSVSQKHYKIDKSSFIEESKSWNRKSNSWVYETNNIYAYDAYGNDTMYTLQRWDSATNNWIDGQKELKTYDALRHLVNEHSQFRNYETNTLKEYWLFNYTIDSTGKVLTHYSQNLTDYCWQDSTFYDSSNRPFEKRAYAWRNKESRWVFFGRTKWQYTVENDVKRTAELEWTRVPNTDSVSLTRQDFRSYNSKNKIISQTLMHDYGKGWSLLNYDSVAYDNNNSIIYLYHQYSDGNSAAQIFFYDKAYDVGYWEGNSEAGASNDVLYPNPSNGAAVNLKIYEESVCNLLLNILDASGKNITSETRPAVTGLNNMPVSHPGLSPATYYVEVINQSSGQKKTFKWVIE